MLYEPDIFNTGAIYTLNVFNDCFIYDVEPTEDEIKNIQAYGGYYTYTQDMVAIVNF